MSRARIAIVVAFVLVSASCKDDDSSDDGPCAPSLELRAPAQKGEEPKAYNGEDVLLIRHRAPAGLALEGERIHYRVESPCYCETFSRPVSLPVAEEAETFDSGACDGLEIGFETLVAIPRPAGGDCRLTVTTTILNDTRTKEHVGDPAKCTTCESSVTCVEQPAATATASATASP